MKKDAQLKRYSNAKLKWETSAHAARIGVEAKGGAMTLAGVTGVSDPISIKPPLAPAMATAARSDLTAALKHPLMAEAGKTSAAVHGLPGATQPMPKQLDDSVKRRAIEFLAGESKVPFDQVAQLYEHERAELDRDAQVKRFLPIFTFRNVQEKLRRPA